MAKIDLSSPYDRTSIAKAVLLRALAGVAGDDHNIEVSRSHYAQTTTIHTIAARTALTTQELVMKRLGATVVTANVTALSADEIPSHLASALKDIKQQSAIDKYLTMGVPTCIIHLMWWETVLRRATVASRLQQCGYFCRVYSSTYRLPNALEEHRKEHVTATIFRVLWATARQHRRNTSEISRGATGSE